MNNIFISGGTGSLGSALIKHLLGPLDSTPSRVSRIVCYSRDEYKQAQLAAALRTQHSALRTNSTLRTKFFIGDVRDRDRVSQAMAGCDTVIHTAALKRVDAVADNPAEVIKTNVLGSINVIDAAVENDVAKVIIVSSDKAVEPMNIYGASKMMAERYAVYANSISERGDQIAISCVRYGNVINSRGSVIQVWREAVQRKQAISVNLNCTRFWLTMDEAVKFIMTSIEYMAGGEIFVPKLKAAPVSVLAEAFLSPLVSPKLTFSLRPGGEKLHEKLISTEELSRIADMGFAYVVIPPLTDNSTPLITLEQEYTSLTAPKYTVQELREKIAE